jgi:hypothetical protein
MLYILIWLKGWQIILLHYAFNTDSIERKARYESGL